MSALDPRWTRWLVWLAPFALLALAIGLQTGWGAGLRRPPPADTPVAPAPVATAVMPEYRIEGGLDAMRATVERPLFNATRRPAPTLVAEAPKPTIQRGQYVLTGTMITDKSAVAFLKDASGTGKSRSVRKGDSLNGMMVAEVAPDRVRLTLGDETEDIELKVQKGPKTTVAVVAEAPPPAQAAAAGGAQPAKGGAVVTPAGRGRGNTRGQGAAGPPGSDAAENLRQNRRGARATEAQGAAAGDAAPVNPPTAGMNNTYRNMQRRQK